ncbi:thioredoxin domain-containing protein [Marmoricola sp. URHB0036]|uniref:thioredoxin domain-containing protein n=1 Tax=Marmoricola sp. URHB0036 TaxID=1298863 RepID=UPI00041FECEE|nr:thioredoxin domain-containing protein [Marmoricola sp. URHB0036]
MPNRLAEATSPYLLQHQDNPVDWWEWGDEAFEVARRRNVPILLSVGYAACHWCHVMAHESFEDEDTAAYLNEHYVSIKVDREERPDVDAVYMQATVAMTGQGGWPMTCVLDHEGSPFFAGTYFPDQPRHGQPSFRQLLEAINDAWVNRSDEVAAASDRIRDALGRAVELSGGAAFDAGALDEAVTKLARDFDADWGGFGGAPKFPPSMLLDFLLRHGGDTATQMAGRTLAAMAAGGIHDQLAGGFARYGVDRAWVVPHFEKMLYDNAQLLSVYARWASQHDDVQAAHVARGVADFMLAELGTAEGAFASALDADSEGEEGTFYVWTPAQLVEVLGPDDGTWAATLLTVTGKGTFEKGTSTLQLQAQPDDPERWESVRTRLLEARAKRERPARDDKVVAAWNGLAISGLVDAGTLLDAPDLVDAAVRCGEFLSDVHLSEGRLLRVSRDGRAGSHAGVLEDYGCVATGFTALACATGDGVWLERAGQLLEVAIDHFAADDGGFHDTADDAQSLLVRPRDPSDNASPSGHSAMLHALLSHAALTGSGRHRDAAERALLISRRIAESSPRFAGWSLAAARTALDGPVEVAVVGPAGQERDVLERAARRHAPLGSVVVAAEPGASSIPLMADRDLVDGRAAAYVCRNLVCQRPVTSVEDLVAQLEG